MRIAVLGPAGTFSDKAYLEYEKSRASQDKLEVKYCPTIDDIFESVCPEDASSDDICDIGIAPIENTLDGYVQRTLDLLLEKEVTVIDENIVPVSFSMIANVDNIDDIEKLFVQFKANGQCRNFINALNNVSIVSTESNMESYYKINDNPKSAAIVPSHVVEDFKDGLVVQNVTDSKNNFTRFNVFKKSEKESVFKDKSEHDNNYRIPVYIMPKVDRPGILFEILESFYKQQINLLSIMSRPTKQVMGTYNFYIEIEGNKENIEVIEETIKNIKDNNNDVKVLGVFDKI